MKKLLVIILAAKLMGCSSSGGGGAAASSSSSSSTVIKRAFVTSTNYGGNLGGNADALCAARATAASLSGTWLAYISYNGSAVPYANFTGNGPWYKMDGTTLLANNLADLIDGSIAAGLDTTEFGGSAGTNAKAWTGYDPGGNITAHCSGFTSISVASTGVVGAVGGTTTWAFSGSSPTQGCGSTAKIYCFEQ